MRVISTKRFDQVKATDRLADTRGGTYVIVSVVHTTPARHEVARVDITYQTEVGHKTFSGAVHDLVEVAS